MKNLILSALILIGGISIAKAQNEVKVKVNVNLKNFQSIQIGSGAQSPETGYDDVVTLNYNDAKDYREGVYKLVNNQLKVSSVGTGYKVTAKISSVNLNRSSSVGSENIPSNEILQIAVGKSLSNDNKGDRKGVDIGGIDMFKNDPSSGQASVLDEELDVKYYGKPISQNKLKDYFNNTNNQPIAYWVAVLYQVVPN